MQNVCIPVRHTYSEQYIKFYQNRSGFVENDKKHFGVFFSAHSVAVLVPRKNMINSLRHLTHFSISYMSKMVNFTSLEMKDIDAIFDVTHLFVATF